MKIVKEDHLPVHEKCAECDHVTEDGICDAYINPSIFWRFGRQCTLSTSKPDVTSKQNSGKVRVGQQKQKKKTNR